MTRKYKQLSAEERGVLMGMKLENCSMRAIAKVLQRSPSTISRELRRNGWQSDAEQCVMARTRIAGGYDAQRAGQRARRVRRACRRAGKLHRHGPLWAQVRSLLGIKLSPEQISATLGHHPPDQPQLQASHETIHTAIYAMPKGDLRRELSLELRQGRAARRPAKRGLGKHGELQDMMSIHVMAT